MVDVGAGGGRPEQIQAIMADEIRESGFPGEVILVRFKNSGEPGS